MELKYIITPAISRGYTVFTLNNLFVNNNNNNNNNTTGINPNNLLAS